MGCLILPLQACSTKPMTIPNDVVHVMPDSLLITPCKASPAGNTVRSLAGAYVDNTSCIAKYQILLDKQRKYKEDVVRVYGGAK